MNCIIFDGRLGRDAEVKKGNNGDFIVFSVATNGKKKGDEVSTLWMNCIWFGERAVKMAQWLKKGSYVKVVGNFNGTLENSQTSNFDVNVYDFEFMYNGEKRSENNEPTTGEFTPEQQTTKTTKVVKKATAESPAPTTETSASASDDDDLPF